MTRGLLLKFCYTFLVCITCLSFGTYVALSNFKAKITINVNDFGEDNPEPSNETSKELTESFICVRYAKLYCSSNCTEQQFPLLSFEFASLDIKPSTPPPDLA